MGKLQDYLMKIIYLFLKISEWIKNRNLLRWLLQNKTKFFNALAILVAILGVGLIQIFKPYIMDISVVREKIYEDKLQKVKIGYSKKYVEDLMGTPEREQKIAWSDSYGNDHLITRTDYIKKDFLYTVFYKDDLNVLGYGLISRNKNFNPRLPSKESPGLLKKSQNSYLSEHGEVRFTTFHIGTRGDVSDYEMDFDYGSLSTQGIITGYGVSEFGYRQHKDSLPIYIINSLFNAPFTENFYDNNGFYNLLGNTVRTYAQFSEVEKNRSIDPSDENRKVLIPNVVLVFDGTSGYGYTEINNFDIAFEFIIDQLKFGFLYERGEFNNITERF